MISKASYLKWKEWNIRNWYHTIAILEIISPHWYGAVLLDLVMAEIKWKSEYLSFKKLPKDKILADKGGHTFELFHKNKKILEIISPHCDIFGVQYCSTWFEVMAEIKWKSPL